MLAGEWQRLQNHSDTLFEFLTAIVLVLIGATVVWYLIIFEDPQVALNPFKPQATPIVLAGILPPTEAPTVTAAPTPAATATPLPTSTYAVTLTPVATATPTNSPSPTPNATPSSQTAPATRTLALNFVAPSPPTDGKWIDVDIGDQTITAYMGGAPLKTVLVSTGVASHPTVIGQYKIYVKVASQSMTGGSKFSHDYYYLPGVPNVMFFYDGYAIHGTYWHHNFGHPMSHGCVNLSLEDAKWFFDWAEVGTTVVVHP